MPLSPSATPRDEKKTRDSMIEPLSVKTTTTARESEKEEGEVKERNVTAAVASS